MTRRARLLPLVVIAAVACSAPQQSRGRRREVVEPAPPRGAVVDDWLAGVRDESQLRPSPLVVRGELIARASDDALELVDAVTLARVGYVGERYASVGALTHETLLGFAKRGVATCELDVIEGTSLARSIQGPDCALMDGARLLSASASEFYVARANTLVRYRIADDRLREVGRVPLEDGVRDPASGRDQMISMGDGRVLAPKGKTIQVYGSDVPSVTYRGSARSIAHLARGSGERVWYSRRSPGGAIQDIVLARLAEGLPPDASISVAPSRVIHMASAESGALAMLLFDQTNEKRPWTIAYLDATGRERWRAALGEALGEAVGIKLNLSFVAVTARRVVLAPPGHPLVAWDTATGGEVVRD